MKYKTELTHPDFGCLHVRQYEDGEIQLKQLNDRIFITPNQASELLEILKKIINKEKQNEQ